MQVQSILTEVRDARVLVLDFVGGAEDGDDGRERGRHQLALLVLAGEPLRPHGDRPRHLPRPHRHLPRPHRRLPLRPRRRPGAAAARRHGHALPWTALWLRW